MIITNLVDEYLPRPDQAAVAGKSHSHTHTLDTTTGGCPLGGAAPCVATGRAVENTHTHSTREEALLFLVQVGVEMNERDRREPILVVVVVIVVLVVVGERGGRGARGARVRRQRRIPQRPVVAASPAAPSSPPLLPRR